MDEMFYRLCLRHMGRQDNCFIFWGDNCAGYYRSLEDAGLYDKEQTTNDDPIVSKGIVDKYKQKVVLPQYGEDKELYADRNEFFVLPNTGQVRKALGLTVMDIHLEGNRNSFNAFFKDTCYEKFKFVYSKEEFLVKGKEKYFDEHWYCEATVEAENRNQAINKVFKSGEFGLDHWDCSFIEFKSKVTCCRKRTKVFDRWVKI